MTLLDEDAFDPVEERLVVVHREHLHRGHLEALRAARGDERQVVALLVEICGDVGTRRHLSVGDHSGQGLRQVPVDGAT